MVRGDSRGFEVIPIDTPSPGDRSYLPDLLGPDHTNTLARAQYRSARRLEAELPAATPIFPTHGFGSFCAATQAEGTGSTIEREQRGNPALTLTEHDFVEATLAGLDAWPAHSAHMAPRNLAGPDSPEVSPAV